MKKRLLFLLSAFLIPFLTFSQETEKGWDEKINEYVQPSTDAVSGVVFYAVQFTQDASSSMPLVIIFLLVAATFFTFYFKFVNVRYAKLAVNTVKGKYSSDKDPGKVNLLID